MYPTPQFPNHKKGLVVFTIQGNGKDEHRVSAQGKVTLTSFIVCQGHMQC